MATKEKLKKPKQPWKLFPPPEQELIKTERRIVKYREHWASQWKIVLQSIVATIALIGLNWLLSGVGESIWVLLTIIWWVEVAVLGRFLYHILSWWMDVVMVTHKRLVRVSGVFARKTDMMPITKVTDITYYRSFIGRLLGIGPLVGFGTIRIESAGQMQSLELLLYVPDPRAVYEAIDKLVFGETEPEEDTLPSPAHGPFAGKSSRPIDRDDNPPTLEDTTDIWPYE